MSRVSINELQRVVYNALVASSLFNALAQTPTVRVFEQVPLPSPSIDPDTQFPYITIGHDRWQDWGSAVSDGISVDLAIHTWTRRGGAKDAKTYQDEVQRILHHCNLTMNNQRMVLCRLDTAELDIEPDGVTHHGIQRFRVLIEGG